MLWTFNILHKKVLRTLWLYFTLRKTDIHKFLKLKHVSEFFSSIWRYCSVILVFQPRCVILVWSYIIVIGGVGIFDGRSQVWRKLVWYLKVTCKQDFDDFIDLIPKECSRQCSAILRSYLAWHLWCCRCFIRGAAASAGGFCICWDIPVGFLALRPW